MYRPAGKKTEDIHLRLLRTPICFVAVRDHRIVGVVRGTRDRLINLFVDGDHHRSGIATRLVRRFERACLDAGGTEIRVLGSLYATTFYQSIGYRKTTGVRNFHGLKVQPMKKSL